VKQVKLLRGDLVDLLHEVERAVDVGEGLSNRGQFAVKLVV